MVPGGGGWPARGGCGHKWIELEGVVMEQEQLIEELYEEDALARAVGIGKRRVQDARKTALGREPGEIGRASCRERV